MMRKALLVAAAGLLMGVTSYGTPASAASYLAPVTLEANQSNIENAATVTKKTVVKKKKGGTVVKKTTTTKRWAYSPRRHGVRYRTKRANYVYYYNGYYYARPWWTIGVPGVNVCIGC